MNFHFQKKKMRRRGRGGKIRETEGECSIEIWEMGFQEKDEKKKSQEDGIMEEVQKTQPSHV